MPGLNSCRNENITFYHRFDNKTWERFNLLSFEIPVEHPGYYDIRLFARFTTSFRNETLPFNMIMNTPSGEERIMEYEMPVRSGSGKFSIECTKDSCEGNILLKRELNISRTGILKIELENLTPHIRTEDILGVGLALKRSGKQG
jgi:hypothetical protein